jgi:hypothetical protein
MKRNSRLLIGISILAAFILAGNMSTEAFATNTKSTNATTQTVNLPMTPGNFKIIGRTGNQLRLNWDWVAGGVGTLHYELAYGGKTVVINHYYPGHTQDVSDLDLTPGHSYILSLWAVDEVGNRSATPARLTFETTPPTSPSNLKLVSMQGNYPDIVSFNLSTDNNGPTLYYEVLLNGRSFGTIMRTDNQFSLFRQVFESYLAPPVGSTTVQLRAFDTSFNSSQLSAPLTVTFP